MGIRCGKVLLTQSLSYTDQNHVAFTDFYRAKVVPAVPLGDFMEHSIGRPAPERNHAYWGTWDLGHENDSFCAHLHGRGL
jgi:hypothetical protein